MGALEFGTYDNFAAYEMKGSAVTADVYEQHFGEVQEAEELGYKYYFIIEHQNSDVGQFTVPAFTYPPWPSVPVPFVSA